MERSDYAVDDTPLHFRSRAQINTCDACTAPSSAIVNVRTICGMHSASGCGVDPRICTRREAKSRTNTVIRDQASPFARAVCRATVSDSEPAPRRSDQRSGASQSRTRAGFARSPGQVSARVPRAVKVSQRGRRAITVPFGVSHAVLSLRFSRARRRHGRTAVCRPPASKGRMGTRRPDRALDSDYSIRTSTETSCR